MAFNIISSAKFRPFSYDELTKPLLQYRDEYRKAEEDFSNLAMQTEAWKSVANQENNPVAYSMYKAYSDELNNTLDSFSKGMNMSNRSALLGLKRRYASEILPIAKASEDLAKAQAFRADIKAKNPGAVFEVDNYDSLDSFLGGNPANNNYWDGDAAARRVAAKAESLGKALFSNPDSELFFNGAVYKLSQLNGMPPEMLMQVLNDPNNINTEAGRQFRRIIDEELESVDLTKFSDQGKAAIYNALNTGLYAGLAKPSTQFVDNPDHLTAYQSQSLTEAKLARQFEEEQKAIASGTKPFYTDEDGTEYYYHGSQIVQKKGKEIKYLEKPSTKSGQTVYEYWVDNNYNPIAENQAPNTPGAQKVRKTVYEGQGGQPSASPSQDDGDLPAFTE